MRTLFFFLAIGALALLAACSDDQATDVLVDEKCGEQTDWFALIEIPRYSNIQGGKRIMIFDTVGEPEDICSKEHAKPTYRALGRSLRKLPDDITLTASAGVPLFTPRRQPMTFDNAKSEYTADIEIGLDQTYRDRPGYITMQVIAEFPSRGDYATDSTYLAEHLHFVTILLKYKKHKE